MAEEATKPAAPAAATAGKYDQAINQWVAANFVNSPISRDVACWKLLQSSLADLKARLAKVS